jgi:Tfp pilus assembly protein PilX
MTPKERRAVLIVVAVLAALIVIAAAVWVVIDRRSANSADKCVTIGVASSMGGNVEHACGKAAHDWCTAAYAQHDAHAQAVQAGCRTAGILP